jgi:hypothetical protein
MGMSVEVLDGQYQDRQFEARAEELFCRCAVLLRHYLESDIERILASPNALAPPGPDFEYSFNEFSAQIFCGRGGRGPLRIAVDTNILIHYLRYGSRMWKDVPVSSVIEEPLDEDFQSQLECLQLLLALWLVRDVRFVVLSASLADVDSRRRARFTPERRRQRRRAFSEFAEALAFVAEGVDDLAEDESPRLILPERFIDDVLTAVPRGWDRILVRQAARTGAHVFLTNDAGVLRAATEVRQLGLHVVSPGGLVEELFASGAYLCMLDDRFCDWPLLDTHRAVHLIRALEDSEELELDGDWGPF